MDKQVRIGRGRQFSFPHVTLSLAFTVLFAFGMFRDMGLGQPILAIILHSVTLSPPGNLTSLSRCKSSFVGSLD